MAHRDIREYDAKRLMATHLRRFLHEYAPPDDRVAQVTPETDYRKLAAEKPWLLQTRLTVKPDMLFGKRGKLGLVKLDTDFESAQRWIKERQGQSITLQGLSGELTHFLIEPFVPHKTEYYFSMTCEREYDKLLFSAEGGVDIEDNWDKKVREFRLPVGEELDEERLMSELLESVPKEDKKPVAAYVSALCQLFQSTGLAYLETNPFCLVEPKSSGTSGSSSTGIALLDVVASVDDTAPSSCKKYWTWSSFPSAFGARTTPEEQHIRELDEKTGASLKFTLLNPEGRVWLLISGGGASVIYTDTVCDLGYGGELANYGEYSGNPSLDETWDYARTVLDLMTRTPHKGGKVLLIGGGIANFTDTAKTFHGIIKALREYKDKLIEGKVRILVRRGGPNYKEALRMMQDCGEELGIPIEVHGPETHMTEIVSRGLHAL